MGITIREKDKGSGIWWLFVRHEGRRISKKIGPKALALEAKKTLEARFIAKEFGYLNEEQEVEKPLFKDFAKIWIEDVVPATCKHSTAVRYKSLLRTHLKPFANKPIAEISRMDVKHFLLKKLGTGLSKSSVNYMKNALSGVFFVAIDSETIQHNPTQNLRMKLTKRNNKPPVVPLTKEEVSHLLETFQKYRPDQYPLALLLARTGMRIGEALALQWGDIDFNGRFITVQRGIAVNRIVTSTKSHKDRRVDMSKQLADCLKEHKRAMKKKAFAAGKENLWLFPNQYWTMPLEKNSWRKRVFYKMLEKAEMRQIRVHDMRHTFASLLIQSGESLVYVKEQLGHHSIQVTVDTYGHLVPGGNKEAVDRLDDPALLELKEV